MTTIAPTVVILASESATRESLVALLGDAGVECTACASYDVKESISDIFLVAGQGRAEYIGLLRNSKRCGASCVVVACEVGEDASGFVALGADDVLWQDSSPSVIETRLSLAVQRAQERNEFVELGRFYSALQSMRSLIAERGDGADVLREILLMAARLLHFERASMMAHVESSSAAYVIAATDDPTLSQFELAIEDYPEVGEAIVAGTPLLIGDVREHPATAEIAEDLMGRGVTAIAVFPVAWKGRSMGALLFRKSTPGVEGLSEHSRGFGTLLAAQLAAQLRDSSLFERMRDQTRKLTRAGFEAERLTRNIDSLSEYFEASAEGVFVVDSKGLLIYVNGTAERLTGFARDALLGTAVSAILPQDQGKTIVAVMDLVLDGSNIQPHDMHLRTTNGEVTVSVTTSTVLGKQGAVILSFRDVTKQRSLEAQLQHSSEFLTNLVDSAVDAIIAVDMRGRVIVFNKGAEQLFGYVSEEVVGTLSVTKLYPKGVARQVMRMLRAEGYGGVGRLEQIRREVVVKSGELVPVNMTASVIFQNGREVATVGIFSDLRDRIRIEQRLLHTQEQLRDQEQRSALAGLAGAAAHELNQPLTSIIGYAQLIGRTAESPEKHPRYTQTIIQEADRMAEIVKKIARITHYETMAYVGSSSIVDLDRSVEASESAPVPVLLLNEDAETTAQITLEQIADSHEEEMRAQDEGRVRQSTDDDDDDTPNESR